MNKSLGFRDPGVAGSFYSKDKLILQRELSMLLEASPILTFPRSIKAIIVPHAGYLYSGGVAARAYSQIKNVDYKNVIVIAPSHVDDFSFSSIYRGLGYKTPLGTIHLDTMLAKKLTEYHTDIRFDEKGHSASEHSLEVHLPILQWCLGGFKLIPISMGKQNLEQIEILSKALTKVLPKENTLIVASSNLSQKYSDSEARVLDKVAVDDISQFDEENLWNDIQSGNTEMSGYGPVLVTMITAKAMGATEAKILLYRNSSEISNKRDQVEGYLSAVLY